MNQLSSQTEKAKTRKQQKLTKKPRLVKSKLSKHNKTNLEKYGGKVFFAESQDSFVELVKQEAKTADNDEHEDTYIDESEDENPNNKKTRKPFKDVNNEMKRLRTNEIMESITNCAKEQQLSTNKLLFYLLYRSNYIIIKL